MNEKKPLICKRCGKKVGVVIPKIYLRWKLIGVAFGIALITQLLTQIPAEILALWWWNL